MRLDRYLANNSTLSRKEVKAALKHGEVLLFGETQKNGATQITEEMPIELNGQIIEPIGAGYFMLFKPEGVVCANSDADHPTVFDLIEEPHEGLHIAGRLDIDTTGLVLITGDGKWSHRVTSPKHECVKTYRVHTAELVTSKMAEKLETGVFLNQEKKRTKPATIERVSEDEILLSISEGRYHQVKRMMGAIGNAVERLHRESIGNIKLDDKLRPGEYRALTKDEIDSVR